MAKLRSAAANTTRYPFRHLLKAGYRVFQPFFRGGLGFGDEFAQANISSQGQLDSDLGDILSGLDYLNSVGRLQCEGKIGIFVRAMPTSKLVVNTAPALCSRC